MVARRRITMFFDQTEKLVVYKNDHQSQSPCSNKNLVKKLQESIETMYLPFTSLYHHHNHHHYHYRHFQQKVLLEKTNDMQNFLFANNQLANRINRESAKFKSIVYYPMQ